MRYMRAPLGGVEAAGPLHRAVATSVSTVSVWSHTTRATARCGYATKNSGAQLWLAGWRCAAFRSSCTSSCFVPARGMTTRSGSTCGTSCDSKVCILCDTTYTSWTVHCQEHAHVARSAVCRFFVMPERSEGIMQHLERHIALDFNEVDALTSRKVERRRERLLAGLLHLVEKGVLRDSIPTLPALMPSDSCTVKEKRSDISGAGLEVNSDAFLIRVLIGGSFLRREVLDRCARLIPSLTGLELSSVVAYVTSTRQVARIFDELSLRELLTARMKYAEAHGDGITAATGAAEGADVGQLYETAAAPLPGSDTNSQGLPVGQSSPLTSATSPSPVPCWSLSREEKAYIMCACIGELHRFHDQERPRSVVSKAAADAIVLNVLAGHGRENLVSELVHETLQRIVDEGSAVWRQHQDDVKRRGLSSEWGLSRAHNIDAQSTQETDKGVFDGFSYIRAAPLLSHPSPQPASALTLDSAAAEQLISSYFPFNDVEEIRDPAIAAVKGTPVVQPSPDSEGGAQTTFPEFILAHHTAEKRWGPLTSGLRQHSTAWDCLPLVPTSPELKAAKKSG